MMTLSRKMLTGCLLGAVLLVQPAAASADTAGTAAAPVLTLDSLNGPVTQAEIASFKAFMQTVPLPVDNFNIGNDFVYGPSGENAEALGIVYEISGDTDILDTYINFADHMLAARNDPVTGRVLWNGKRELTWPNKKPTAPDAGYSATENGDIIQHIANCAKLILQHPELWDKTVPLGDAYHYGETYLERAKTYVKELDRTEDTYMIPNLIHADTLRQYWPSDPAWVQNNYGTPGTPIPWNQQMMIDGGFQRLAECHELLGDDPQRVAFYDRIIQTSIDWFMSDLTEYQKDGHNVYTWYYQAEDRSKVEEFKGVHAAYDLLGLYRAYERGKYGITEQTLQTFADTIQYVIDAGDGSFYYKVDADPKYGTFVNDWPEYAYMTPFNHADYPILVNDNFKKSLQKNAGYFARILWVKNYPGTAPAVSGTPGSNGWYTSHAAVTIPVGDRIAGDAFAEYSLAVSREADGTPLPVTDGFQRADGPIALNDGINSISYRLADADGHAGVAKQLEVKVDATAPQVSVALAGAGSGSPLTDGQAIADGPVAFAVAASDSVSGVAQLSVQLDGAPYVAGAAVDLSGKPGAHTISCNASDNAGNVANRTIPFEVRPSFASIQSHIDGFTDSGDLAHPVSMQVTNSLSQAKHQYDLGHRDQAAQQLHKLIGQLNNQEQQDGVSQRAKAVLAADTEYLIQAWTAQ